MLEFRFKCELGTLGKLESAALTKQAEMALSALYLDSFCLLTVFETASHYEALADLELLTVLPLLFECRYVPPYLAVLFSQT